MWRANTTCGSNNQVTRIHARQPRGADGASVCVTWSAAASLATWLVWLAIVLGLLIWQVRQWRRNPRPFAQDD